VTLEHVHFYNTRNREDIKTLLMFSFFLYYLFLSPFYSSVLFSFPFLTLCVFLSAPITVGTWSVVPCSLYICCKGSSLGPLILQRVSFAQTVRKRKRWGSKRPRAQHPCSSWRSLDKLMYIEKFSFFLKVPWISGIFCVFADVQTIKTVGMS
jgi:hypothetical protein